MASQFDLKKTGGSKPIYMSKSFIINTYSYL